MLTPNLFIVGFQKCGSSSLFDLLIQHPDVVGTCPKETFFLTDPDYDNFDVKRNVSTLGASWEGLIPEIGARYVLEASVCNFYQKTAQEYISARPESKVIFVIRNPVERFISNYSYYYGKVGGINSRVSVDEYYKLVKEGYYDRHSLRYALAHGAYSKFIARWVSMIGERRVHVLSLEQLRSDTQATIQRLFEFLDLPALDNLRLPWRNKSTVYRSPRLHRFLHQMFKGSFLASSTVRQIYTRMFHKSAVFRPSPRVLKELRDYYSAEYTHFKGFF